MGGQSREGKKNMRPNLVRVSCYRKLHFRGAAGPSCTQVKGEKLHVLLFVWENNVRASVRVLCYEIESFRHARDNISRHF